MSLFALLALFVGSILFILVSGIYIANGLVLAGILGFECFLSKMTDMIGVIIYNSASSYTLSAIPLFLFMGEIIKGTGITENLYRGVSKWMSPIPGGLILSNIFSCSIFAAVSGSAVATAAAIGSIAYPEQRKRGYSRKIIAGSLAGGGSIGILIPPSITMIIYGSMTGVSVGKLFMGGVIPGILMSIIFMLYILIYSIIKIKEVPEREKVSLKEYLVNWIKAWADIWPFAVIITTIFISIYRGFATPTEAAGLSVVIAMIIGLFFKTLNFKILKEAALSAIKTSTMILFIMIGAFILGNCISMLKLPAHLIEVVENMGVGKYYVLLYIFIVYLVLGCIMESASVVCLTTPIVYPLLVSYGFSPIWIGILVVLQNQVALITPPVGMNVFVIHSITGKQNIGEIFSGVFPYFILMLGVLLLIIVFPELVTFLPDKMVIR